MYNSKPINKIAAIVTSQKNCSDSVFLDREGIIELIENIKNEMQLIKAELGIKNRSQYHNRKYYRIHIGQNYNIKNKQKFQRLLELGLRTEELKSELIKIKIMNRINNS